MSIKHSTDSFSHLNQAGEANMVDVTAKIDSVREAIATADIVFHPEVLTQVLDQGVSKGDLFATARIAGIQAAKRCADLIPLCHPLPLSKVSIEIEAVDAAILRVQALCKTTGKTGVEMEALTAASVAALTIYDMCKAIDKSIVISEVKLLNKSGGKSGNWAREA